MRINECSCGCGGSSDKCAESGSDLNYMFFGNLETMKRMIDELVQMDPTQVDEILKGGHEWAVDHIASSADDVQEVYNFLKNRIAVSTNRERDPFSEDEVFVRTFESYVNEVSNKKWRSIEDELRGRKMNAFADRVAAHNKEYGTNRIESIRLIGKPIGGYNTDNIELDVTDLRFRSQGNNEFDIIGRDNSYGTVVLNSHITHNGELRMFESGRLPVLAIDRRNARNILNFLLDEGVIESPDQIDWRSFTNGYVSFGDAYNI